MARVTDILRTPFAFLFSSSKKEEIVAEYVIREHHIGRPLADILDDAYVTNRLSSREIARLLDRPDVLHAVGGDMASARRAEPS